jgi:hypothetical protein
MTGTFSVGINFKLTHQSNWNLIIVDLLFNQGPHSADCS